MVPTRNRIWNLVTYSLRYPVVLVLYLSKTWMFKKTANCRKDCSVLGIHSTWKSTTANPAFNVSSSAALLRWLSTVRKFVMNLQRYSPDCTLLFIQKVSLFMRWKCKTVAHDPEAAKKELAESGFDMSKRNYAQVPPETCEQSQTDPEFAGYRPQR